MKKSTKRLLIKARRDIFGELSGNNISSHSGDGFDFYELRPYTFGEDVRRIDWKRSAKMNEPYVKLFHEEKELQIIIVPLLCGSLGFGVKRLKQSVVVEAVALLGFSALKNSDRYTVVYQDKNNIKATPLSKKEANLYEAVEFIEEQSFLGVQSDMEKLNEFLQKRYKRRSLIVFIGDFWQIPKFNVLAKRHEVLCINVRDRFEENPVALGQIRQINPDNLAVSNIFLDKSAAKEIHAKVKIHDNALNTSFAKQGIRVQKIYTDENVYGKLNHFLRR